MRYLILAVLIGLPALAGAAETVGNGAPQASKEKIATKEVKGEVTHVGKRAISVEYSRKGTESYEMLLPLTADIRFVRLRDLSELKTGDTVKVKYQQTYREDEKGERVILNTVATEVALLRSAPRSGFSSREAQLE